MISHSFMFSWITYLWYSNRHKNWPTWIQFSTAVHKRWKTRIHIQEPLRDKARSRYRQKDETARCYFTCL